MNDQARGFAEYLALPLSTRIERMLELQPSAWTMNDEQNAKFMLGYARGLRDSVQVFCESLALLDLAPQDVGLEPDWEVRIYSRLEQIPEG